MIDGRKVRMMTKTAIYEKGIGRKEIKMHRYSKRTWLSLKMLGSFVCVTAAYFLASFLYVSRYYTDIISQGLEFQYVDILIRVLIVYIPVMAINLILTGRVCKRQYEIMEEHVKEYDKNLYHLKKYLEKTEELSGIKE